MKLPEEGYFEEHPKMIHANLKSTMDWAELVRDDGLIKGKLIARLESAIDGFKRLMESNGIDIAL